MRRKFPRRSGNHQILKHALEADIDRRERLIEEAHIGIYRQCGALALATGQFEGIFIEIVGMKADFARAVPRSCRTEYFLSAAERSSATAMSKLPPLFPTETDR